MASPIVTGAIALLLSTPLPEHARSLAAVKTALHEAALPLVGPGLFEQGGCEGEG